ncbi:MAG: GTPase HflX [Candidatus Eisenbacteria bacterium]|nr:GTPase HflX [Candidatus Eisenbacteria bacterium]
MTRAFYDTRSSGRRERAVLVGFDFHATVDVEVSLRELALLADTAGADVCAQMRQKRGKPSPSTYLTKGKVEEAAALLKEHEADLLVCDEDLSPAQIRNLEKAVDAKVIDRSELILDIFSRRARTRESRLQVELAQLEYSLPRLTGMWKHLERLGGGIGTRGPGETQLETDRRLVRTRISNLKKQLEKVEAERQVQRKSRTGSYRVAIVGYTNAGKSTLMKALTSADVFIEDRLFATVDSTTRRLKIGHKDHPVLVTDTVGFIRKLPHHLVASFRSTLSEVLEADLLYHVADAADPALADHLEAVEQVLHELGADQTPRLLLLNKVDRLDEEARLFVRARHSDCILTSARTGLGLAEVKRRTLEARTEKLLT